MSSLKKISERIKTIKSTHQVTSSMKVVAVSRLRKLHEAFLKTTPYMDEMNRMIRRLIRSATLRQDNLIWQGSDEILPLPPLLKGNGKDERYIVVVITSDDGLSGSSNVQVVKKAQELISYLKKNNKKITVLSFGTKGAEILKRIYVEEREIRIVTLKRKVASKGESYLDAERLSVDLIEAFNQNRFDVCLFVYNQFKSVVFQFPTIDQLIPGKIFSGENPWQFIIDTNDASYIARDALGQKKIALKQSAFLKAYGGVEMLTPLGALDADLLKPATRPADAYDYEGGDITVLERVLPQYLTAYVNRVLLETDVADNAARLMAMDNATRNAEDMLQDMQKIYRRTRQSKITTDITEVVSGAMAQQQ
ncbi:MAG: ATP synthase F1 subunit gamma [Alphaproteobacteria bacterium]|nr:ATP synthase F1 subunit gamma [Alphaproteobacteria bacterium]